MTRNHDWMDDAVCTPDPAWTADHRPDQATVARLRAICWSCPVMAQCASYALDYRCQSGMYAGVWVPAAGLAHHRGGGGNAGWLLARGTLSRRAMTLVAP